MYVNGQTQRQTEKTLPSGRDCKLKLKTIFYITHHLRQRVLLSEMFSQQISDWLRQARRQQSYWYIGPIVQQAFHSLPVTSISCLHTLILLQLLLLLLLQQQQLLLLQVVHSRRQQSYWNVGSIVQQAFHSLPVTSISCLHTLILLQLRQQQLLLLQVVQSRRQQSYWYIGSKVQQAFHSLPMSSISCLHTLILLQLLLLLLLLLLLQQLLLLPQVYSPDVNRATGTLAP